MSDWQRIKKLIIKDAQMHRLANEYANKAMWGYIEDYKDEFKKPNPVDKMRHRAIKKQCFKRAKKELNK